MDTKYSDIPVIQKSKVTREKSEIVTSGCCSPKTDHSVCCTPSEAKEENNGACCAQPEDGSACCNK